MLLDLLLNGPLATVSRAGVVCQGRRFHCKKPQVYEPALHQLHSRPVLCVRGAANRAVAKLPLALWTSHRLRVSKSWQGHAIRLFWLVAVVSKSPLFYAVKSFRQWKLAPATVLMICRIREFFVEGSPFLDLRSSKGAWNGLVSTGRCRVSEWSWSGVEQVLGGSESCWSSLS